MYNKANIEIYEMYLESNKARNYETLNTTYKIYKSNMLQFMSYLKTHEGNKLLLSEATIKNCVSILERYINYCRNLGNNNQTINNKLTAISSFYIWCVKRDLIKYHPFQHKLDRLRKGDFDKRRESYFLSIEDIIKARILMEHNSKSTIRARIKKIGELIGYDRLYPHTLRKTAINLLSNLSDINFASEYANHTSTKVTKDHYIKRATGAENRDKILQIRREKGL